MPIDYTSTTGSLQVRLGKMISLGKDLRAQQGSTLTNINEVAAQYTATTVDRAEYVGPLLTLDSETLVDGMAANMQASVRMGMERTVIQTVSDGLREVPDLSTALRFLAIDMIAQSQSIGTTQVVAGTVSNTATGTGRMVVAVDGKFAFGGAKFAAKQGEQHSILPETLNARCTMDARDGRMIRGNEAWEIEGKAGVARLDRRWQDGTGNYGSGAALSLNSTCGNVEGSRVRGQNMLSNSGFERVDGTPFAVDWQIQTGTAGTSLQSSTTAARGSRSLKIVGDNAIVHNIYEVMGEGPRPNIKSNTTYIVSAWLRGDTGTVNTGTIEMGLRDGSNVQVSGANITRNMAGAGLSVPNTGWTHFTGSFTTPLDMPSSVRFVITFSVKLGAQTLLVDDVCLVEAVPCYLGGPMVGIFAGTADWELDDRASCAITKTANEWQVELDRYLNLAQHGIQFPVSTSPTFASTHIG